MLTLSRSTLRRVRICFGKALGITARSNAPPVTLSADGEAVHAVITDGETAIRYSEPTDITCDPFAISLADLRRCEGGRSDRVAFTPHAHDKFVSAQWHESGIARSERFDTLLPSEPPPMPDTLRENPPELMTALAEASATATSDSSRYALDHLRLSGSGQVAATDSRQLFVQGGFDFPWTDDLLIPSNRVFASASFRNEDCGIGRTDNHVVLRSGPWTLWLSIANDVRFPKFEPLLDETSLPRTILHLSESDAQYLAGSVKNLPGAKETNSPLTLDLGERVILRVRADASPEPTEVELPNSHVEGDAVRIAVNRTYLARAAALGFRTIRLVGSNSPLRCDGDHRTYLAALLDSSSVIEPTSKRREPTIPISPPPMERNEPPMPQTEQRVDPTPLQAAEALRDSLRESLSRTRELVTAIKKESKQAKLVESTLASLRKLSDAA